MAVERARNAAGVAEGKTLHDLRGAFATRLMREGFKDAEIDEILGWETRKSAHSTTLHQSRCGGGKRDREDEKALGSAADAS